MSDFVAIQAEIASVLENIVELELAGFGYVPDGGTAFPVAFTEIESAGQPLTQGNDTYQELTLNLYVLFGVAGSTIDTQAQLAHALDTTASIPQALLTDQTLGGTVHDLARPAAARVVFRDLGEYQSWGLQFELKMLTDV